jgi:hypothetical protein
MMGRPCQIIYHIGTTACGETINDFMGEANIPTVGDVIERDGKMWRVTEVKTQVSNDPKIFRIVRIYLSGQLTPLS